MAALLPYQPVLHCYKRNL